MSEQSRPHLPTYNQEQTSLRKLEISKKGRYRKYPILKDPTLFLVQERWQSEASNQPEGPESVCLHPPLQNEGCECNEGLDKAKNWLARVGLKDAYFTIPIHHTHLQFVFHLPIQLPTIQSVVSPMGLYQDPQTNDSSPTRTKSENGSVHRQHANTGGVQGTSTSIRPCIPTTMPWLYCERQEVNLGTNVVARVPLFHGRHSDNGNETSSQQDENDSCRSTQISKGGANVSMSPPCILGNMNATSQVISPAPYFYCHLQMTLSATLGWTAQDYEAP